MKDIIRLLLCITFYTTGLLSIEYVNPESFTWLDFGTDGLGVILIVIGGWIQKDG